MNEKQIEVLAEYMAAAVYAFRGEYARENFVYAFKQAKEHDKKQYPRVKGYDTQQIENDLKKIEDKMRGFLND